MSQLAARLHLPRPATIEAYGNGGFRFAGMSHRGSLLCLPDGIWAWPVRAAADIDEKSLSEIIERADRVDFVLVGAGRRPWQAPASLRAEFATLRLSFDAMTTGAAVRTYNVLVAEGRRAAAALVAVE